MCKRSQQIIKSWYQTYFIVKSRRKAILGLKRNNGVFTIPLVSSPKQLNIAVSSQKKRDSRPIQSPLYTAYYSWREMGCNLVSILFLATTSSLGPVRLGEKVRGIRMMWGIKIRIPITLPSPPLPSPPLPRPRPRPRPCPLFELIKIIAVQARRGDTRRKKELFYVFPAFLLLSSGNEILHTFVAFLAWSTPGPAKTNDYPPISKKTWLSLILHFFSIKHNHDINFICKQQSAV